MGLDSISLLHALWEREQALGDRFTQIQIREAFRMHKRYHRGRKLAVLSQWQLVVWAEWFRQQEAVLEQSVKDTEHQLQVSMEDYAHSCRMQHLLRNRQITGAIKRREREVAARSLHRWRLLCQARVGEVSLLRVQIRLAGRRRRWIIAQHMLTWQGVVRMGIYFQHVSESQAKGRVASVVKERVAGWRGYVRLQKLIACTRKKRVLELMRDGIEALVAHACAAHVEKREASNFLKCHYDVLALLQQEIIDEMPYLCSAGCPGA